ncbi:MAG: hypothetical protein KF760_32275 [Candidatus Eremiobacteraeota bacterium]|nr:hypothetical protein [Candidatus Eremiobacteraeota bacterium]MCW5870794.1 hypothetical protein [Candidatus Eremiobacteraeota bacterium]
MSLHPRKIIERHSLRSVLQSIGALLVMPENAPIQLRLEFLANLAASANSSAVRQLTVGKLAQLTGNQVHQFYSEVALNEDPPENLFARQVRMGPYLFEYLTGLNQGIAHDLPALLNSIAAPGMPREFSAVYIRVWHVLLSISSEILHRLSPMTLGGDSNAGSAVTTPVLRQSSEIERWGKALSFSWHELAEFLKNADLPKDFLDCYIKGPEELAEMGWLYDSGVGPLAIYPIVRITADEFIVPIPSALVTAARVNMLDDARRQNLLTVVASEVVTSSAEFIRRKIRDADSVEKHRARPDCPLSHIQYSFGELTIHVVVVCDFDFLGQPPETALAKLLGDVDLAVFDQRGPIVVCTVGLGTELGGPNSAEMAGERITVTTGEQFEVLIQYFEGSLGAFYKFLKARRRFLAKSSDRSWSLIDFFSIYRESSSIYLGDSVDVSTVEYLQVPPGSGRVIRNIVEERFGRRFFHHPSGGIVEAQRVDPDSQRPIFASLERLNNRHLFRIDGPIPIWVESQPLPRDTPREVFDLYFSYANAIAYWLYCVFEHWPHKSSREVTVEVSLTQIESWFSLPATAKEELSGLFDCLASKSEGRLLLTVRQGLTAWLADRTNVAEVAIAAAIIPKLCRLIELEHLELDALATLKELARNPHRAMLIGLDTKDPRIDPSDLEEFDTVSRADEEELLEELGAYFSRAGATFGDPDRVLNECVGFLFGILEKETAELDPAGALEHFLSMYEYFSHSAARLEKVGANRLHTDGHSATTRLAEDRRKVELATTCSRFLVEYIAAKPCLGQTQISSQVSDRLLAVASQIVYFGTESDMVRSGLLRVEATLLASGRLGLYRSGNLPDSGAFNVEFSLGKALRAVDPTTPIPKTLTDSLIEAYTNEYGISLVDLHELLIEIANRGNYSGSVGSASLAELKSSIPAQTRFNAQTIAILFRHFTLAPRKDFFNPPGFGKAEVFPWKMNRKVSLLTRPLVINGDLLTWGKRTIQFCSFFILQNCSWGRYKADSKQLQQAISKLRNWQTEQFNQEVHQFFSQLPGYVSKFGVDKFGTVPLERSKGKPLGDIDVLAVDTLRKRIWLIECKDFAGARTGAELKKEVEAIFEEGGYVERHLARTEWIRHHLSLLIEEFQLSGNPDDWALQPVIVTDRQLFTPNLKKSAIPVVAWIHFREQFRVGAVYSS